MRKCRCCDFPKKFARFFNWRSDGTIVSTDRTKVSTQITFLEAGEMESLFKDLSETIGINVDRFLLQAQKNIGKALYANLPVRHLKKVPANRYFRPQCLASLLVKAIAGDIAGLGDGRLSLDKYDAGEVLVIRFTNPVVAAQLVGSAAGMYESMEEMPCSEVEYHLDTKGDLVITLTHGTEKPAQQERLYLEEIGPGEGPLRYERCLDCGVPVMAARTFSWDMDQGIIHNRKTGGRDVVVAVQSVNATLRELESELGEDVMTLVHDHQKALSLKGLAGEDTSEAAEFLEAFLREMALRGLGYPRKFEFTGDAIFLEIGNAYNQVLYAAKVAAALEKITGKASSIEWEKREPRESSYRITT